MSFQTLNSIRKEGWLRKGNKKRYFILNGETLTWLEKPLGKVKGSINLRNYVIVQENDSKSASVPENASSSEGNYSSNGTEDFSISITPLDSDHFHKSYLLIAASQQEWKEWLSTLTKAKNTVTSSNDNSILKVGWLEKKGKMRWFLLKGYNLYWYSKEQSEYSELLKDIPCNGSLDLRSGFTLESVPGKYAFTLLNSASSNNHLSYTLTAHSESEKNEWMSSLQVAIQEANRQCRKWMECDLSGWLVKKGKRRFVVLKDHLLVWYLNEKDRAEFKNPQRCIDLEGSDVISDPSQTNKFSIVVSNNSGTKKFEFLAKTRKEQQRWISTIEKIKRLLHKENQEKVLQSEPALSFAKDTVLMQGWLLKNGKKRFVILSGNMLHWFSENPNHERSRSEINLSKSSFSSSSSSQLVSSTNTNTNDDTDTISNATSIHNLVIHPIGSVFVSNCSVFSYECDLSFVLNTTSGKSYFFRAGSVAEASQWVSAIRSALASNVLAQKPSLEDPSSSSSSSFASSARISRTQMSGWLLKLGKPRWFLALSEVLMWFEKEQSADCLKHPKGSLHLAGCSVKNNNDENPGFLLVTNTGRHMNLTAKIQDEVKEWCHFLQEAITRANQTRKAVESRRRTLAISGYHSGWTMKKGKKRWLLLNNNFLFWYAGEEDKMGSVLKGSFALCGCSCSLSKTLENTLLISSATGKIYQFTVLAEEKNDKDLAALTEDWLKEIQKSIKEADELSKRHYMISELYYDKLVKIITSGDLVISATLLKLYESNEVATAMFHVFYSQQIHQRWLNHIIFREIMASGENDNAVLFRNDSPATRTMRVFLRMTGQDYLRSLLVPFLMEVSKNPSLNLEIDPAKTTDTAKIPGNIMQLRALSESLLNSILSSIEDFPMEIRIFLRNVSRIVCSRFPEKKLVAINACVFLRWLMPATFSPEGFQLISAPLSACNRRTLILVTKVLQSLANDVLFSKEEYMLPFNDFIREHRSQVKQWLEQISETPLNTSNDNDTNGNDNHNTDDNITENSIGSSFSAKDRVKNLSVIVRYLDLCQESLAKNFEQDPRMIDNDPLKKKLNRDTLAQLKAILSQL